MTPRFPGRAGAALHAAILADLPEDHELDAREVELLAQACRAADHLEALEAVVAREGVTAVGSKGQVVTHPALVEARLQRLAMLRLLSAIGLEERATGASFSPTSLRAQRAANARWARRDRFEALRGGRM